jgi:glycosyltransferase involved in cell wall biosynthesis
MRVALVGYCSPLDLKEFFFEKELDAHNSISSIFRGTPVSDMARALVNCGHQVSVVTISDAVTEKLVLDGINGFRFIVSPRKQRARVRALTFHRDEILEVQKILNELDVDVVHAHWTYEFAISAARSNHPAVVTVHDAPLTILRKNRNPYFFFRWLLGCKFVLMHSRRCHLVFVSPYLLNQWKKEMVGFRGGLVIPNANPFAHLRSVPVAYQPRTEHLNQVISVADDSRRKNIANLVKSWKKVVTTYPDVQLNLVGPGLHFGSDLQLWAAGECLDTSINWCGVLSREELTDMYLNSCLMVHPSREESFGLVFLEAMSLGLRIIANSRMKYSEYVLGDIEDAFVDCEKIEDVSEKIINELSRLRTGMKSNHNFQAQLDKFEPIELVQRYLSIYELAINEA